MIKLYAIKRKGGDSATEGTPFYTGKGSFSSDIREAQTHIDPVVAFSILREGGLYEAFGGKDGVEFFVIELQIEEVVVQIDVIPVRHRGGVTF